MSRGQDEHRILVITSSHLVAERMKALLREKGIELPVLRCDFEETVTIAQREIAHGTRVIISRGYSAVLLRGSVDVPVVEVRMTGFNFISAVNEAHKLGSRIAIVGYEEIWKRYLEQYRELLGDLAVVYVQRPDQLRQTLRELRADGVDTVIGGHTTCRLAKDLGMQTVHIGVEDGSLYDAVAEAEYLLRIETDREERYEMVASLLDCTEEGAVAIDADGRVSNANTSAAQLLGASWRGLALRECLSKPELVGRVMAGGEIADELSELRGVPTMLSGRPITTMGRVQGAVFTMQPVRRVQMLEQRIRKKLTESGNHARYGFHDILGSSDAITAAREKARRYASSSSTVLITGETGTGKELFAQSIHNASRRAAMPFVAINCAALPQDILESELFGYVKGAFTGARSEGKAGVFEQAHQGTIFLDEIGELSYEMQSKLLRVLQEKEIRRIGDTTVFRIDVRVIAATNKDLQREMEEGRFRSDLFYRLAVLELALPSLRERSCDIPQLVCMLLQQIAQSEGVRTPHITQEALALLSQQPWPGNVRQVRNVVERLLVTIDGDEITGDDVRAKLSLDGAAPQKQAAPQPKAETEQIVRALRKARGNREEAARLLGISKTTLWRRIVALQKEEPGFLDRAIYGTE